jgi:phenylacetate-CoA ligase
MVTDPVAPAPGGGDRSGIPEDRLARNPLITPAGYDRLKRILQHPDAPRWNYEVGDRVTAADLAAVDQARHDVRARREAGRGAPPPAVLDWVMRLRGRVPFFRAALPPGVDPARDWSSVPTMTRAHLAARPEDIVPADEDLSRLIVYDTSGVTGHAIRVPHHPRAIAQNHAFMEFVLEQYGVSPGFSPGMVACMNVGAQVSTVVFATVFSVWNQAGFAKVNLHPRAWERERARRFFADLAPAFLTGDPLGFAEMLAWRIDTRPAALLTTAVTLLPGLKARLEAAYGCPVIDTYATTETGPIAYANPDGEGLSLLPHDIYVEVVDDRGRALAEGEYGEICVTGGRNPFVPLLRYRTGDFGRLRWSDVRAAEAGLKPCPTADGVATGHSPRSSDPALPPTQARLTPRPTEARGKPCPTHDVAASPASLRFSDPAPRIVELSARPAVAFRASDGSVVSPVDIGRIVREWVFVQHAFVQRADGSCDLAIRPAPGCPVDAGAMRARLETLFGSGVAIEVRIDRALGDDQPGGKVVPFRSESH